MVATTSHIFSGKVDIASNLQVGSSHLFVDTENNRVGIKTVSPDASLHVVGNVYATSFEGDGSLLTGIASNLEESVNSGNVTSNTVQFTNPNTGIVTTGNVDVGNKLSVASLTPGSVPYIDGENTLVDSYITQGVNTISIASNLEVTGNILITGDSYKIDSQSLEVKDRIIGIAYENTLSGADTGILMEYPTKNIGLIHHGASGNPYAQEFTIGYTQNTSTDTTILHDTANNITVNVLGHLHTQNNMTVETGGSYYGDGTTLTGVALSVDMTSNALRITNVESVNGSQTGLITGLRTDVTTLTTANTVQASLITGIKTDMTSNASRITTLESANTVQGGLITAIETDVTDNASRITTLESANTVQGGLITVIETNLTDNASRVTSLEATDAVYAGLLSGLRTDLDDTFITKTSDTTVISSNLEVTGNIFMRGERFIIESETTLINDAIIGIANNNTTSTTDVGILMQRPNANVALVHHGGTDTFTIGYTQDTLEATDITNDTTNEINVNVLGQLHVQNNLTVGTGGSYYGDGTTLTGVALSTDMTSNASRITTLESANTVQGSLITAIETDVTDNALRITNLEASNVNIWSNLASNVLRIDELVASNTDIWSNLELLTLNDVVNVNNATSNTVLFTNTDTSLVASGNVTVSGNVTSITSIVSNATTMGTTKTFVVTVNGNYYIDGVERHLLELHQGQTYIFDMSDSTNSGHPLAFSTAFTGSSSSYTTGVVSNHDTVPSGTAGSKVTFSVPLNAPSSIYYYCTQHGAGMGSTGTASSISPTAELIVSGRVVASGNVEASAFKGDGTTLTGVALKVDLVSNVTRITNLETSNLTYTPLITGLRTDVDAHDTRLDLVEPRVSALEASNVDIWSNLNLLTLNDVVNVNNATSNTVLFTNANTSLVASGNVTVSGNVTSTTSLISNAATLGTTKEFVVTHAGGAFYIDGLIASAKPLELHEHQTYLFDLTALGAGHPFRLATVANGGGGQPYGSLPGSDYTTGTDYSSIANHLKFTVPSGAPSTLYSYCTQHSNMGGSISIASTAELIVSGRVVASGNVEASSFKGDGTELSGIALKTDLVSNVTRIASLRTDMTANAARVDALYTATMGDIIVATGTNALGKLGIGGSGQVLKVKTGGTTLEWANESGGAAGVIVSSSSGISGFSQGDLIYASGTNTLTRLPLGTVNQVLKSDGTNAVWGTGGGAGSTPWVTNGNKIFYNTDNVGIGTNAPAFKLDVHGTANVGALTSTTLSVGGAAVALDADMTANAARVDALYTATTGDIIYATGTDALGKLNIGVTTGHVLKVSASGTPEWAAESGGGGGSSKWTTVNTNEIHYSLGNVGIANTNPGHDLSVGSNLFVDDSGSNVLVIDGNVAAESMTIGGISIVPSYPLSSVTDTGNVTPHTIEFTNATTGLVTTANVEVGGELTVSGNVVVDTDTLFVDSVNDRVGVGTTSPSDKLHIYGSPMIQHDTVYDTANASGWYKIGEWDPTNITGARLKISFLGGNGYSSELKERGGETILYATCNNNNPSNKANIEGMIHAYGNAVITQIKFKHLDNSRHKFEIRAFVESYSQMAMKIECTQTDTFTKYFTSSTDLGAETVDISHAIFTHEFDNDGSLLIGTTTPYYSQRFQVSGGHSRFESGPYSRSQGKRYNYNFQTSGNNNHTLTIPINGASTQGIMKLKINVIQVAANASGSEIAELEGYISAYGGTHGITATKAVKVESLYAEHICSTSGTSSGNLKIYYRPKPGDLQDVSVMFDIELQLGATFAHAGSLSHVLSGSNAGLATKPTFNTTRYEIDGYVSVPVSLSFDGTAWITVTSGGSHLGTGTWIVQAYISSAGGAGTGQLYDETYSGFFTWYSGTTNSGVVNDIALHNAGHAPNGEVISMRTRRTATGGVNLIFEINSNQSWGGTARTTYFSFRRLL